MLGVRQGDSVITLFYQKLELEVNLYNYGEIAHFGFRDMKICVSWNFGLQCCGTSIPIWGKITAVRGKSAWFIWRMSRRLISALTVLHRSRIWCHTRCRKGLSCRSGCDGAAGEAGERLAAGWLDSLLSQTSINDCNQMGGTRPAP